jgi:hypothetical protein
LLHPQSAVRVLPSALVLRTTFPSAGQHLNGFALTSNIFVI